jgi:hypothetical protein
MERREPPPRPQVRDPATLPELLGELSALHQSSTAVWMHFDAASFYAPLGSAWSPADNVRHLIKSCRPVARALRVPKLLLLVPGAGVSLRGSRSYAEVRETYRRALAGGVQAGRFAPRPEPPPLDPEAARGTLMAQRETVAAELHGALDGWSERALDRFRMPHPALGQLTVREMLHFTLYHNLHHVENVAARLGWWDASRG